MTRFQKILVPINLDFETAPILDMAAMLAAAFGAQVVLAHVFETPGYDGPASMETKDSLDPAFQEEVKHWRTAQAMMKLLKEMERRGVAAKGRMVFGDAEETLSRLAKREAFDLIVVGSRSRQGLERFLTGSVAEDLLRSSPCPVLILPHIHDVGL